MEYGRDSERFLHGARVGSTKCSLFLVTAIPGIEIAVTSSGNTRNVLVPSPVARPAEYIQRNNSHGVAPARVFFR